MPDKLINRVRYEQIIREAFTHRMFKPDQPYYDQDEIKRALEIALNPDRDIKWKD